MSNTPTNDILSTPDLERHIPGTIMKLAWPAILEQFLICMTSLVDTAMVGSIGAIATAAVAVNISSVWMINGFSTALSVGFSYLISHAVGEGDPKKNDPQLIAQGTQTLAIAAATELFFSFFGITFGICRGSGDVKFSLMISIIGMWGFRIGLVWLAVNPLQAGIAGVWIAIAIDCAIRMVLCIWRLKSGKWKEHNV